MEKTKTKEINILPLVDYLFAMWFLARFINADEKETRIILNSELYKSFVSRYPKKEVEVRHEP